MVGLQPITIGSRTGTVLFINHDWQPVERELATLAHVAFDDGGSAFFEVTTPTLKTFGGPGSGRYPAGSSGNERAPETPVGRKIVSAIIETGVGSDFVHGLYGDDPEGYTAESLNLNTVKPADIAYARAEIQKLSQEMLREKYGDPVTVYRGYTGTEKKWPTVSLTLDERTAKFHSKNVDGRITSRKFEVPLADVLSFSDAIGKGTYDEKEIIVHTASLKTLGGPGSGRYPKGSGDARPVAITEHLAAHKGMEMVAIKDLLPFITQDRRTEPKSDMNMTEPTETLLPRLTQELRDGQAIQEPLSLAFDADAGRAILIDGNTRLAAIEDAGFTHAPVVIMRQNLHGWGRISPELLTEKAKDARDWVLPSDIGLPTLLKKNVKTLGGSGSGNFGHSGRPGEIGGSSGEGGTMEESRIRSKEFTQWFGQSKVVDEYGDPLVVYHGTTHDIQSFAEAGSDQYNPESDWGAAPYFTNSTEDMSINYAGIGPDLTSRIENRADQIMSEAEYADQTAKFGDPAMMTHDDAMAQATEELTGHAGGGVGMPVYLAMDNPYVVGKAYDDDHPVKETYLSSEYVYENPDDPDSDIIDVKGTLPDFTAALINELADHGYESNSSDVERFTSQLQEYSDGISASKLDDLWEKSEIIVEGDKGGIINSEIFRRAIERAGFDGVIDRTVNTKFGSDRKVGRSMEGMNPDTVHYIPFKPTQIKSAIGNRKFDPTNPVITLKAYRPETLVHKAADAHLKKMQVAISYAFAKGRAAVDKAALKTALQTASKSDAERILAQAPAAVAAALLDVLPTTLTAIVAAGGTAGLTILQTRLRAAGSASSGNYGHTGGAGGAGHPGGSGAAGSADPERSVKIARLKELRQEMQQVGSLQERQGGLTGPQAKAYETTMAEYHSLYFDVAKPLDITKIASAEERKSTLTPETIAIAHADLRQNKEVYLAVAKAADGVHFGANTPIDEILDGKNPNVSREEFIKTFDKTREALQKQYGDTVPAYRASGRQAAKASQNWATTREFAAQFGSKIVQRNIPVSNILAVNVGPRGNYHELIVDARVIRGAEDPVEFRTARPQVKGEPHSTVGKFGLAFNVTDPNSVEWVKKHTLELSKDLSETTKDDVAEALERALEEGDLDTLYDDILDAIGDEDRAELIAHNEIMTAANEGQRESWDQAVEAGLLTGDEKREWIATDDSVVCPDCEELDGQVTDLDGEYPNDGGDGPPLHPRCRCTEGISAGGPRGASWRFAKYNPTQKRDKFGNWTKTGATAGIGQHVTGKPMRHVGVGFPVDSPLPEQLAVEVGDLIGNLSEFEGLDGLDVHAMAVFNSETASETGKNAEGEYNPYSDRISVAYGEEIRRTKSNVELGPNRATVGSSPLDQAVHEIGHHVWFKVLPDEARKAWTKNIYQANFGKQVSKYAGKDAVEGFAEVFSAYVAGKGNQLPKAANEYMKKYIGQKNGGH